MRARIFGERRRFKESSILFKSDKRSAIDAAISAIRINRTELETYIARRPEFQCTLNPVQVEDNAPLVVRLMAQATRPFEVGPMAAVAGVLADLAVEAMLSVGAKVAIVENGGEVSAVSDEVFTVALHAGRSALSNKLGFQIIPSDCPIGVATSSATVSHALSFGQADAATVFADTAGVADGAATAICNAVRGSDVEASVRDGLAYAKGFIGLIRGVVVVREKYVGSVGKIPQLINVEDGLDANEFSLNSTLSGMVGVKKP